QQPLLVALHREAWGGERFFDMLDRVLQDPARHRDLMELQYLSLAFGFGGRYQAQDRGHVRLAEIQQDVYRQLRAERGAPAEDLSPRWAGLQDRRNPLIRYVPWWVVAAAGLAVLTLTFILYYTWLGWRAEPIVSALGQIGVTHVVPAGPRPAPTG